MRRQVHGERRWAANPDENLVAHPDIVADPSVFLSWPHRIAIIYV